MTDPEIQEAMRRDQARLWAAALPGHALRLRRIEGGIHQAYRFPWRVAEAPAVVPRALFERDLAAMRRLAAHHLALGRRHELESGVPLAWRCPGTGRLPLFLATDYQRVLDPDRGAFRHCVPEIQGFPGNLLLKGELMAGLSDILGEAACAPLGPRFRDRAAYRAHLFSHTFGDADRQDCILLEVRPREQKTLVDMLLWVRDAGVRLVDFEDLLLEPRSGALRYRRAIGWHDGGPVDLRLDPPATARVVLSRCLPAEVEASERGLGQDEARARRAGIFQESVARGAARFVVHPADFFAISKATLATNPHQDPPLIPLTPARVAEWRRTGFAVDRGVVKPAEMAGGAGLRGLDRPLALPELEDLAREIGPGGARWLWQERYPCQEYPREGIPGHAPASPEERDPVYHELRLMWGVVQDPRSGEADLELLSGMTRWSRVGEPANAGRQRTTFTGTHGILVV
jgi:hypothetical protein